nr:MAG TPA: hypothetical protein [Bacteriophage sp.]
MPWPSNQREAPPGWRGLVRVGVICFTGVILPKADS